MLFVEDNSIPGTIRVIVADTYYHEQLEARLDINGFLSIYMNGHELMGEEHVTDLGLTDISNEGLYNFVLDFMDQRNDNIAEQQFHNFHSA